MQFNENSDNNKNVNNFNDNKGVNNEVQRITDISLRETSKLGLDQEMVGKYISNDYNIDLSPFVGRYFWVTSQQWATSTARYTVSSLVENIPQDVFDANLSLTNAIKMGAIYRSKLTLAISLGGTLAHSGCILVSAIPPRTSDLYNLGKNLINTALTSPHAFLYANEATSVELSIPWYCNTDYAALTVDDGDMAQADFSEPKNNYGTLVMIVVNPLVTTNGSNSIQVSVEARFDELDVKIPMPKFLEWKSEGIMSGLAAASKTGKKVSNAVGDIFDGASKMFSALTGLHNPNKPVINSRQIVTNRNFTNQVEGEQMFEKLDPYTTERITDDYIFGTRNDEMLTSYIVSKEQFVGTFSVTTGDVVGKLLWSRPIAPWQGAEDYSFANNISLMYFLSRAWQGDFEIILRSSCTNKQQFKLIVSRLYHPQLKAMTGYPTMGSIANSLSQMVEFSGGGQEHIIEMPYLARTEVTPCTQDLGAVGMTHGIYYVYLSQVLTIGDDSPTTAEVNVFIRSKNLSFYGYSTENPLTLVARANRAEGDSSGTVTEFVPSYGMNKMVSEGGSDSCVRCNHEVVVNREVCIKCMTEAIDKIPKEDKGVEYNPFRPEGIEVMNEPQMQTNDLVEEVKPKIETSRLHRIHSVRDIVRRMYLTGTKTWSVANKGNECYIPLKTFLNGVNKYNFIESVCYTPLEQVASMYYGRQVGFKVRLVFRPVDGTVATDKIIGTRCFRAYYLPPNVYVNSSGSVKGNLVSGLEVNEFPLPLIDRSSTVINMSEPISVEFVIPNVSFYKFVSTVLRGSEPITDNELSIHDFGHLIIKFDSLVSDLKYDIDIYVGLTDESRLGFHCAAPLVRIGNDELGRWTKYTRRGGSLLQVPRWMYYTRTP